MSNPTRDERAFTTARNTLGTRRGIRRTAFGLACAAGLGLSGGVLSGCTTGDRTQSMLPTRHGDVLLDIDRRGPEQVRVGEEFAYTIRLTNTTDQPLHNVRVHETVGGENFSIVSATPAPSSDGSRMAERRDGDWRSGDWRDRGDARSTGRTVGFDRGGEARRGTTESASSWNIGHMAPGETKTITVRAMADQLGDMRSCVTAEYDLSVCTVVEAVAPQLQLVRGVDGPSTFYACDPIELTYRVTNTGSASTRPGVIEEPLPTGLRTADGNRSVRINVGAIQPGDTVERTVTLRADDAVVYANRASMRSGNLNVKSAESEIRVLKPELELTVDGSDEEYLNRTLAHTVTVRNVSDDPARDVVVTTDLDDGIENVSYSTRSLERAGEQIVIGDLGPGESRSFTVRFDAAEPGTIESTYTLTGYCVDEQTERVSTAVKGIPAVLIEVVDRDDPVAVSEEVVYEIRVKNQGSANGLDIQLSAPLPAGMEFVRVEGDRTARMRGNMVVFEPIPQLAPGETHTWDLHLRATQPGRTKFELRMENAVTRTPIIEQEATTIID